jgi:hypothetical protein
MDYQTSDLDGARADAGGAERRQATRYTSLIRSAKLVCSKGEFVCVVRDVSETGISLRSFHSLPSDDRMELVLQNGLRYELNVVRMQDLVASFTFPASVDVEQLIVETGKFPKRQLRVEMSLPTSVTTLTQRFSGDIRNLSQQGALLDCEAMFAIEQPLQIEASGMPKVRAKVRWRQDNSYGLAFDNHFSLSEFALLAAKLQCPELLQG